MNTDRVLTIIGIIIGLPAFLALFFSSEHRLSGFLCVLMVLLVLGARWWVKREADRPQFTSLELRKHFKITAADGSAATYERVEKMRANFQGISEWWNRNILQDGTVTDILIDSRLPDIIDHQSGGTNICKRFARPLEKGEILTVSMTYTLHDSFPRPHESVIHNNVADAKEVIITVDLPKPCTRAELRRTYSGEHGKLLDPPQVTMNNLKIEATIKKPLLGASYHVEWDW